MFEDYKMHTEMEIRHHWVPMVLFERLIEKNPNGTYKGITNSTVVFQVEDENFTEQTKRNRAICQNGGRRMSDWITCKSGECQVWFNGTSVHLVDAWRKLQVFCKCEVSE